MKNKKLKYVLLPLVFIIWGLIFYKIYNYISGDSEAPLYIYSKEKGQFSEKDTDTFSLIANYRDPFLKQNPQPVTSENTIIKELQTSSDKKTELKAEIKKEVKLIRWPKVHFLGLIVNQKSSKKTALIKINTKEFMFNEGNTYENITLNKIFNDSVHVSFSSESKSIIKSK